ncbi:ABC transporter [Leucobacter komagatae]|uniref:ABC transporter n=2 Tax=Leucobacter komagatae TaxID=55969 RepID=A0A0D0IKG8_9MICO|nr:ABC transporter [Leucobacter komagatae]
MTDVRPAHVLEINNVSVTFKSGAGASRRTIRAMNDITLAVAPGETLGLVGESGSGKSTSANVALGLQKPDSGEVKILGNPFPRRRRQLAGKLQAVLQHPAWSLNPRRKIGESVREPLTVSRRSLTREAQHARVRDLLDRVGLDPALAERYPHELSGGQRQRVSVARALITEPQFIVFDEAVSALDVAVQAQILQLIRTLQADHQFGALFISHDLGAVKQVADRVAVLFRGDLVETAETAEFFRAPQHEYSQRLLAAL